jgi:diguanylate cyclase (GGDEF)-like protein
MNGSSLKVLMVEDDSDFVSLTRFALAQEPFLPIEISHAATLQQAIKYLFNNYFHAILLDLNLPDSSGLETFNQIRLSAPQIPIVVLSANRDYWTAIQSVREGAQDYLLKGENSGPLLARSLYYAVERNQHVETLRRLSLLDGLTNLYNRRGFLTFAEQFISLAQRSQRNLSLVLVDVDYLKAINDNFGHAYGDEALIRTANILRKTFRRSDIIGRIGGDEFSILAIDVNHEGIPILIQRLFETLKADINPIPQLLMLYHFVQDTYTFQRLIILTLMNG